VVEHIEKDKDFLLEINHYLTVDGILLITVPAYNFLWSNEDTDAGHFRRYTLRNLKKKLNEAGFKTIYSTYIFSFLILPVFVFRTLPSFLRIAKSGMEKYKKEHNVSGKGLVSKLLTNLLYYEMKQIRKNRKIPFGGSCLIVAKKEII